MAKASEKKPAAEVKTRKPRRPQQRSENYKNGQWDLKYLQFVNSFLSQIGMTSTEAADKAGFARNTIYHWFKLDNAKLSSVEKLIESCGYKISFSLKPATNEVGDALMTLVKKEKATEEGDKKLSFLDEAMDRYGISRKDTAEKLGIGYTAMYYWFKSDDIFISYIYKIAEMHNLKVLIKIDPID